MLIDLRKFKVYKILALDHKKRNDCKMFPSDIQEALKSVHQSIFLKIKNYASEDCIVLTSNL